MTLHWVSRKLPLDIVSAGSYGETVSFGGSNCAGWQKVWLAAELIGR